MRATGGCGGTRSPPAPRAKRWTIRLLMKPPPGRAGVGARETSDPSGAPTGTPTVHAQPRQYGRIVALPRRYSNQILVKISSKLVSSLGQPRGPL